MAGKLNMTKRKTIIKLFKIITYPTIGNFFSLLTTFAFVQTVLLFTYFSRFDLTFSASFGFKVGGSKESGVFNGFGGAGVFLIIFKTFEPKSFLSLSGVLGPPGSGVAVLVLRGLAGSKDLSIRRFKTRSLLRLLSLVSVVGANKEKICQI